MKKRQRFEWEAEAERGSSFFVKSSRSWDTVVSRTGRNSKVLSVPCARAFGVGGVTSTHTAQGRVQHCSERQHQLAMEWGHDQQGTCLGSKDTASHLQAPFQAG